MLKSLIHVVLKFVCVFVKKINRISNLCSLCNDSVEKLLLIFLCLFTMRQQKWWIAKITTSETCVLTLTSSHYCYCSTFSVLINICHNTKDLKKYSKVTIAVGLFLKKDNLVYFQDSFYYIKKLHKKFEQTIFYHAWNLRIISPKILDIRFHKIFIFNKNEIIFLVVAMENISE